MTVRQAAEFATHRPGYWEQVAYDCWSDFALYFAFVRGFSLHRHQWPIVERLRYSDGWELVLGPPDVAKTTVGVAYAEWTLGRQPNYRWLCASKVATGIATTIVSDIGGTIELNERFHLIFGLLKDPSGKQPWSTHSITLRPLITPRMAASAKQPVTPPPRFPWLTPRGRDIRITGRHPSAKAIGWRVGYAGARCDGILADDLVDDELSRSARMTRNVFEAVHQKLLPRLTHVPDTEQRVIFFGQQFGPRDFYSLLREHGVTVFDNNPRREGMERLDPDYREVA